MEPVDVKRVRELEQENGRVKKMVADRELGIDVLKEITRKNGRCTRAPTRVAYARLRGLSGGRACALLSVAGSAGIRATVPKIRIFLGRQGLR